MTTEITDALPETVLRLVREYLEDDRIQLSDNFLDVGGHSLAAQQINEVISRDLGKKLPLPVLFDQSLLDACEAAISAAS